jgi:hypothetical protein
MVHLGALACRSVDDLGGQGLAVPALPPAPEGPVGRLGDHRVRRVDGHVGVERQVELDHDAQGVRARPDRGRAVGRSLLVGHRRIAPGRRAAHR